MEVHLLRIVILCFLCSCVHAVCTKLQFGNSISYIFFFSLYLWSITRITTCSAARHWLQTPSVLLMLLGKQEPLHLGACCCVRLKSTGIFCPLEAHSPAVKDGNCLWSLTLWTYVLPQGGFIAVVCVGAQTLHSSAPPVIRFTFVHGHLGLHSVYLTSFLFPHSLRRGCDMGWHEDMMCVGPLCSCADFISHISHPSAEKLNIATLASSFS